MSKYKFKEIGRIDEYRADRLIGHRIFGIIEDTEMLWSKDRNTIAKELAEILYSIPSVQIVTLDRIWKYVPVRK